MLIRLLAAALAVVACAWFVLGARQAHDLDRAGALLGRSGTLSAPAARQIQGLLSSAGALNPDRQVEIDRAALTEEQHHPAQARAILNRVVAEEPMNVLAWVYLAQDSAGDRANFKRAFTHIKALDPPQSQSQG